jgi:hypothetical protein
MKFFEMDKQKSKKKKSKKKGKKSKKSKKAKDQKNDEEEEDEVKREDYEAVISLKNFAEFTFYHVGYFCFFGPMWNVILMMAFGKKGYYLFRNMIFWGIDKFHMNQMMYWMTSGGIITLNYFEYTNIHKNLIWLNYLTMSFRIFMITAKYGCIEDYYLNEMKTSVFKPKKIANHLTMLTWRPQPNWVVDIALTKTVKRQ